MYAHITMEVAMSWGEEDGSISIIIEAAPILTPNSHVYIQFLQFVDLNENFKS
jgi:hypothetical protein